MSNKEILELIELSNRVFGPNNHAILDMRSSIHRRLAELQGKAKNELDDGHFQYIEHHLTDVEYA